MTPDRKAEISRALQEVRKTLPEHITLIVVTKTFPLSDLKLLYELGERNFGENRDDEGREKSEALPDDVIWHFQGGVQSNKLRSIVGWSDYIHSLDDLSHAKKISELALHMNKKQQCFIQINLDPKIQENSSRSGISPEELTSFAEEVRVLEGISVVGVMGVGPLHQDPRPAFEALHNASQELQRSISSATFISGGMSGDYEIAIECGATHVRIGSSILGSR